MGPRRSPGRVKPRKVTQLRDVCLALPLDFLPVFPLDLGPVLAFGIVLLVSTVAADVLFRIKRIPRAITYIVVGMVFGAPGFNLISPDITGVWRPVVDVALAVLLFQLGQRLDLMWLRNNKWLAAHSLLEAAATFCAVFYVMGLFGIGRVSASLVAAVAVSTSPSVTISIITEARSRGQTADRLVLLSGINSAIALMLVQVWIGWAHLELAQRPLSAVFHPFYVLAGSLLVGLVTAVFYGYLSHVMRQRQDVGLAHLALVLVGVEVAYLLRVSPFLSLLAAGLIYRTRTGDGLRPSGEFGLLLHPLQAFLFLGVGASSSWQGWSFAMPVAAALVFARAFTKTGVTLLLGRPGGLSLRQALGLGLGLLPMSALAFLLAIDALSLFPEVAPQARSALFGMIAMFQLAGPLLARLGLGRLAGEFHPRER